MSSILNLRLEGRQCSNPDVSLCETSFQNVEGFANSDYPLHQVATREWEGFIFVRLAKDGVSFEDVFAPIYQNFLPWHLSQLEPAHRIVYDVAANWKLIFQNYSECYHCPKVHPALNKLTPYRNTSIYMEEGSILGGPMQMSADAASMTVDGRACAAPIGDVSGDDLKLVYYYTIFPTMFLGLHPDYVLVHRLEPVSPGRTRIYCDWLFHPDAIKEPTFDPKKAIEFWDDTNRQDWHVCELSQKGIESRAYTPGPYSDLESLLAAFDRHYLDVMNLKRPLSFVDEDDDKILAG